MIETERPRTRADRDPGGAGVQGRPSFEAFAAARATALQRTAYLLTHDHAQAEDLVQTALAKAWLSWDRIETSPEAYVRRVMLNTFSSWWRRRWTGEIATDELPAHAAEAGGDPAQRQDLWTAMARLPRRQRATVVLRYFEDLTEAQTADLLGCSVGTVKSQASKALAKLRIDPALARDEEAR